jgi:hypothetical protein
MIRRQMSTRRVVQQTSRRTGLTALAAATLVAIMPITTASAGSRTPPQSKSSTTTEQTYPSVPSQTEQSGAQSQGTEQSAPSQGTEQYRSPEQGSEQYRSSEEGQGYEQYRSSEQGSEQYGSGGYGNDKYSYGSEKGKSEEKEQTERNCPTRWVTWLNDPCRPYRINLSTEAGFFVNLSHELKFGNNGSNVDMIKDADQALLFPYFRFEGNLESHHHNFTLAYQPLSMVTHAVFDRTLVFDHLTIPAGTAVDIRSRYPFWRASYLYDFSKDRRSEVSFGASLQARNAQVSIASGDGVLRSTRHIVTVMPSLKFRTKYTDKDGWFVGFDADAFFATIPFLNGTVCKGIKGLTIDTALKAGLRLRPGLETYLSLRYLGSGNEGTFPENDFSPGGFSKDWVHVLALSLGVNLL